MLRKQNLSIQLLLLQAEIEAHEAPWLKNVKEVFRDASGRFASRDSSTGESVSEGNRDIDNTFSQISDSLSEMGESLRQAGAITSDWQQQFQKGVSQYYEEQVKPFLSDPVEGGNEIVRRALKKIKSEPETEEEIGQAASGWGTLAGTAGRVLGSDIGLSLLMASDIIEEQKSLGDSSKDLKRIKNLSLGREALGGIVVGELTNWGVNQGLDATGDMLSEDEKSVVSNIASTAAVLFAGSAARKKRQKQKMTEEDSQRHRKEAEESPHGINDEEDAHLELLKMESQSRKALGELRKKLPDNLRSMISEQPGKERIDSLRNIRTNIDSEILKAISKEEGIPSGIYNKAFGNFKEDFDLVGEIDRGLIDDAIAVLNRNKNKIGQEKTQQWVDWLQHRRNLSEELENNTAFEQALMAFSDKYNRIMTG